MHIAFFNRSFYPDTAATGQLLTELCESLVRDYGARVSVVAGVPLLPSVQENGAAPPLRGWLFHRESYKGIEIFRARGTRFPKRYFFGRLSNYLSYFFCASWAGLRLDRPDVVVALTDPPIIGVAGFVVARRFGARFVMSYRDVFPEAAKLLEDFQSDLVNLILEKVNRFLVRRAHRVVALGETMASRLIDEKGADPARTLVIPDWADCAQIVPGPKENPFSRAHGLADKFVVMHSGNMGLSQGLDALIQAAAHLSDHSDIRVVLIGEGVKKSALEDQVKKQGLTNVRFLPYQPKERLAESFACADCFVVSLKEGLAGYIVPSKIYGILAAGRPFVAAVEEKSEVAQIARQRQCGLVSRPADPQDLAQKILALYRDRQLRERLGENARKAALLFDRSQGVKAYQRLFSELVCVR